MSRLMADPLVMRWFDVCRPMSRAEVAAQLGRWLDHQQAHGFAPGLIRSAAVGHGGLARYAETEDRGPELIYLFDGSRWGQGLASEFARAVQAWGFRELGVDRILSTVRPENSASARLLERAGVAHVRWWPEYHRYLYSISSQAFANGGTG